MTHNGGRVILIEDDEGMREAVESLLAAAGYTPTAYASAEALLATATATVPDACCVISDIRMLAMSGLDLLDTLRASSACPPVILITAHDSPMLRREAARRGAAAYLPKPFAGGDLLNAIARVSRQPCGSHDGARGH